MLLPFIDKYIFVTPIIDFALNSLAQYLHQSFQ